MNIKQYDLYLDEDRLVYLFKEKGMRVREELNTPDKIVSFMNNVYKCNNLAYEKLYILVFDIKYNLRYIIPISSGNEDTSFVPKRKILSSILLTGPRRIVMLHNHPSANSKTSIEDINITKEISKVSRNVGLLLEDHIIIGYNTYTSLRKEGYI